MMKASFYRGLLSAAALAGFSGLCSSALAQCPNYVISSASGGTITPGVNDVGNHADDGTTYGLPLPFGFNFYGTVYNSFNVCSNGVVSFGNPTTSTYVNVCPLTNQAAYGPAIFAFWDDLYTTTTASGQGVFTTTTGVSPNQNFYIEYRTQFCCSSLAPVVDFEIVLHEAGGFDIIYTNPTANTRVAGNSATVGCQDGQGNIQSFNCSTSGAGAGYLTDGQMISFACPTGPVNPSVSLAVAPTNGYPGGTITLTGTVIPGFNPVSSNLAVSVDAGSIGAGTVTLYDDGSNGDATAGDHIFTNNNVTVSASTPDGPHVLTATVTDGEGRSGTGTATFSSSQYCAVSTGNNAQCTTTYEFISNVTLAEINDTQPCSTPSYQDHSDQIANLQPGVDTPLSITIGSYWGADHVSVYIDWDNNHTLNDAGEEYIVSAGGGVGSGAGSATFSSTVINAPANAAPGPHRMRVWLTYNIAPTPCLTGQTFGQIKDYTVNVANSGPHCGSADFNCDGSVGTDSDIEGFFACLAGNCPPPPCTNSADFDGDGSVGTDNDIAAFFRVLGGGNC